MADSKKRLLHSLYLNVAEAKNLKAMDFGGTSDPYVVVSGFGSGVVVRTPTVYKELNPFWGAEWQFDVSTLAQNVQVIVFDENKKKDVPIGKVIVPFSALQDGSVREQWYPLMPVSTKNLDFVSGVVELEVTKTYSTLTVRLIQARGLASKDSNGLSDPYVKIMFADLEYKTETHFKTLDPVFEDTFQFALPSRGYYERPLYLTFWDYDKLSADDFMGSVVVELADLEFNSTRRHWYDLSPVDHVSDLRKKKSKASAADLDVLLTPDARLGSIRLKMKYTTEVILDADAYEDLFEFLASDDLAMIQAAGRVTREREPLAKALVSAFSGRGKAVWLLNKINAAEIKATETANIIFRGNSLASKSNDMYLKLVGHDYLDSILSSHIKAIYASDLDYEVDPTRVEDPSVLPTNWANLTALVESFLDDVLASADAVPEPLKYVFAGLVAAVKVQFPGDEVVPFTVVSAFLFLRFICPAILGPKLFFLMETHPEPKQARTLTLVAKTLQNLANLVAFGPKEPFMHPMNNIIESFMDDMREFLTDVSTAPNAAPTPADMRLVEHAAVPGDLDWPREMAKVHNHFDASLADIGNLEDGVDPSDLETLTSLLSIIDAGVLGEVELMSPDERADAVASIKIVKAASQPMDFAAAGPDGATADDTAGEDEPNIRAISHDSVAVEHASVSQVQLGEAISVEDELAALEAEISGGPSSATVAVAAGVAAGAGAGAVAASSGGGGGGGGGVPIDTTVDDGDLDAWAETDESSMVWNEVSGGVGGSAVLSGQVQAGTTTSSSSVTIGQGPATMQERAGLPVYSTALMEEVSSRVLAQQAKNSSYRPGSYVELMGGPGGAAGAGPSGGAANLASQLEWAPSAGAPGSSLFGSSSVDAMHVEVKVDEHGFQEPQVTVQSMGSDRAGFGSPDFEGMDLELDMLVEEMKTKLRVENKLVSKIFPNCFVGSEAVDFILILTKGNDRTAAQRIGQQLLDRHVFRVLDSDGPQSFVDGYTYYQLTTKHDATMPVGLLNLIDQFKMNVRRGPKETRKTYRDVFLGFELVSFIVTAICKMNPVREQAVKVGRELFARNIIAGLEGEPSFEDGYAFYYMVEAPVLDPKRVENVLDTCGEVVFYEPEKEGDEMTGQDKLVQAEKALHEWVNLELRGATGPGPKVLASLSDQVRDGLVLNALLSTVSPSYSAEHVLKIKPTTRADELDNIMLVLRFLQEQGLGLGDFIDPAVPSMYSGTAMAVNEGNLITILVVLHALRRLTTW